jgi:ubiquinone/menaquinone biosynthesis C-methylase UbiE
MLFRLHAIKRWLRITIIRVINSIFGYRYLNIGAGQDSEMIGWWCGDYQTGFVFNETTPFPIASNSIHFAYSSMFFEHITDAVAHQILSEANRTLKKGGVFRIVVPDFNLYLQKYREKDLNFFYDEKNENFMTWESMSVPIDLEHLLAGTISSIHNLPHILVPFPHMERLDLTPALVCYPFQKRYEGYYCGPAPELTTELIQKQFNALSENDFIDWVLKETNASQFQDPTFNSWHKNRWDLKKIISFAQRAGFQHVEQSQYGKTAIPLSQRVEKEGHQAAGLYFNLIK